MAVGDGGARAYAGEITERTRGSGQSRPTADQGRHQVVLPTKAVEQSAARQMPYLSAALQAVSIRRVAFRSPLHTSSSACA
jgi:hypothetical protein